MGFWDALLKAGGKAAKNMGQAAAATGRSAGQAVLHPSQTLRGAGQAMKTAAIGIEKDFTYHSSRHSAATLAITAGAELYSVSKILGHGSIASTQVYAKVNMEKKVEAMSLTNGVF